MIHQTDTDDGDDFRSSRRRSRRIDLTGNDDDVSRKQPFIRSHLLLIKRNLKTHLSITNNAGRRLGLGIHSAGGIQQTAQGNGLLTCPVHTRSPHGSCNGIESGLRRLRTGFHDPHPGGGRNLITWSRLCLTGLRNAAQHADGQKRSDEVVRK